MNNKWDFLSGRKATIIVISIAIISRLIQLLYFYNIRFDASYQVIATYNFLEGNGISIATVDPADLSKTIIQPLINWPPGYSLLLAPFYLLTGGNYILAGLILDIIAAILLIFYSRRILVLLRKPLRYINLFTLANGLFIYYFYFVASSDAIAITFMTAGIYYTISMFAGMDDITRKSVIVTICLALAGFIKYLFIPVLFVIPAFIFLRSYLERSRLLKQAGITIFLSLLVILGGLLLWHQSLTGSAAYISQPERGFFPEHLLKAYPFIPGSFLKPESTGLVFPSLENVVFMIFQWLHFAILLLTIYWMVNQWKKGKLKDPSPTQDFLYLLFLLSFGIIFLLGWLSLTVAQEEILPGSFWTYIEEPRYYGLLNILVHLALFTVYETFRERRTIVKLLTLLFTVFLILECGRGTVFNINRIRLFDKEEYSWQYEHRFQKYTDDILQEKMKEYNTTKSIVTGSSYYMNNRVAVYSHTPVLNDIYSINDPAKLRASEPSLLIVIIHGTDSSKFTTFLDRNRKELAGEFNGFYFYAVYVQPDR